ncbi:hypothetical protein JN535_04110 [Cellulosimicrobium cellulans]|uniref:hypothetical protein n=1 Tax=Cellulosimicrobium cellulans TaxID=1710 RepID=UPI0019633722|nr:hypothetical protein [Cellulosimicrobium cellulans]MBN0039358.1 hypothetical protein [Cellulosimicrobium cellulans]
MAELVRIGRPRVVVEPLDPNDRRGLWFARCEHCPWVCGPTAKSWLDEHEARLHRARHRGAEVPVCAVEVVMTESGEGWTWRCACGTSVPVAWHGSPFEHAAADPALDAISHGHRGPITWPDRLPVAVVQAADKYVDARRAELEADYLAAKLRRAA